MKSLSVLMVLLAFISVDVSADDPPTRESVEELLVLVEAPKLIDALHSQAGGAFETFAEQLNVVEAERPLFERYKEKTSLLIKEEINWEVLKEPLIDAYARHYTAAEVHGLVQFYSTEVGKSALRKMPALARDTAALSHEMIDGIIPELEGIVEEMEAELEKSRQEATGG